MSFVLLQEQNYSKFRPIGYKNRSFNEAEKKYNTT